MKLSNIFTSLFVIFGFFIFVSPSSAATTSFHSASTITTDGNPDYTNLQNCSATDGLTCDRAQVPSTFANLYFKDFGNFGIPAGSTINYLKIRVTGRSNIGLYVGVSPARIGTVNCQFPSDLWTMWVLNSPTIATFSATTSMTNGDLSTCLTLSNIDSSNFTVRVNYSGPQNWFAKIDNLEIAFDYTPGATPTPTPTPAGPTPFLDLPWDYQAKGETFSDAALSINSYFDHTYPLLSSGLGELLNFLDQTTSYDGKSYSKDERAYSSHDGYDYGHLAKVNLGDMVLAAAAGNAQFINNCGACGNMIVIDHGNGYQTRYMHLLSDGLIVATPGANINVIQGQIIGKVGATGNVQPVGDAGAHIHFGVFQDKNHDGNFEDNIPDGVTDPFGWQSNDPDPWANYTFLQNGIQKTGNKSYYLWKKKLDGMSTQVAASTGGTFTTGHYTTTLPGNSFDFPSALLDMQADVVQKTGDSIVSLIPGIVITLKNAAGDFITQLDQPMGITVDFSNADVTQYKVGTISIYSSNDGITWAKENTNVNYVNKTANTNVNHLTHFALMGEKADIIPPITTASLSGDQGQSSWYRSDVNVVLSSQDNDGGLGVDYTLYKLDNNDWDTYVNSLTVSTPGHHKVEFYSADLSGNIEDVKSVEFDIDKTPPIITHLLSTTDGIYIPGVWTNKDVLINFSCTDDLSGVLSFTDPITVSSESENQTFNGQCLDLAGNIGTDTISGINIDKTAPIISISATPSILWPPNGKNVPVLVNGSIDELHPASKSFTVNDEYGKINPTINEFGDIIQLPAQRNDTDSDGRHYVIKVNAQDLAGNSSSTQTQIIVPHDNGN